LYNDGWLAMHDNDDDIHGPDHHGEKSEALPTPSTAMSVGRASDSNGSINADEWLMDTGSGVDIVSRASVAGCKRFVTKNAGITLMTANGELDASDEIEVYIKCVDTHVRLLVLDDSPNVLSTGKLCVDQGWGFHWHPFSKTPYMTKPGSGERVYMTVDQYCPYMKDSGAAVPSFTLTPETRDNHTLAAAAPLRALAEASESGIAPDAPPPLGDERAAPPAADTDADADLVRDLPKAVEASGVGGTGLHDDAGGDGRRDLKAEARSFDHLLRHMPFNKYCETCVRAKMLRRPARRATHPAGEAPKKFGDLVNADHIIAQSDEAMGLTGERDALAIVDRYSDYKDCFPLYTKDADEAQGALIEFFGTARPKYMWTDSAPELIRAIKNMKVPHGKATPSRHQNNGYCERVVRKIVEGARALLEHAGLPSCFWTYAVRHWCFMDNVAVTNGDSPWNLRHGKGQYAGPLIPFGCLVDYLPKPEQVKLLPKFEPRGQQGIFMGYYLQPGGQWKHELLVFPLSRFTDYDFTRPRKLTELRPRRTMEAKLNGPVTFPMKEKYDIMKRTLPLTILRAASFYEDGAADGSEAPDVVREAGKVDDAAPNTTLTLKPDSNAPLGTDTGSGGPAASSSSSSSSAPGAAEVKPDGTLKVELDDGMHYRTDAIGRSSSTTGTGTGSTRTRGRTADPPNALAWYRLRTGTS
jgi:hypothetical protein